MKPYIEMNTNLRAKAKSVFEKDFFKLMNNSVFGKTMENIRNRVDVRLVTSEKEARKLISRLNYTYIVKYSLRILLLFIWKRRI